MDGAMTAATVLWIVCQYIRITWITVGLAGGPSVPDNQSQHWPRVKPGIWEIEARWTGANGKMKQWKDKTSQCHDPEALFQGYWGQGIVERGGCRFRSTQISATKFQVTTECMVRNAGVATSEGIVSVEGDRAFTMTIRHREGKRIATIDHSGHWLSSCPEPPRMP
jgi:hypothetical protein